MRVFREEQEVVFVQGYGGFEPNGTCEQTAVSIAFVWAGVGTVRNILKNSSSKTIFAAIVDFH